MPNTPSLLSVSPYSRAIAREMYPGQMGQDDQQDAARHMLAAGTMARKYGPTVADLAGKAHEYSTSPLRALMTLIGRGQMPPDYEQDMHNNALGIELARRAKSQRELEDLIQSAAERPATTRTEGRPWVNKAKGGEVSADELNRPFIGYRSAGRRPESQQDRRAAADAPLSALRGMVSGVLGAPGDIESLIRMLPGLSERTVLPTSEDVEKRLPMPELNQTPTGRAFTTAVQLGGGFYTGPGAPLRAVAALPSAVSRAGRDFVMAAGQPAVNVVKPKGGNWLAGTAENAVAPLRVNDPAMMQVLRNADPRFVDQANLARVGNEGAAIDKWLETKLAKYIRNEMATPEDPVRALAERGITHAPIEATGYNVSRARREAGFPEEGMATSPMAKLWEDRADTFVNALRASDLTGHYPDAVKANPWLLKVPPETPVYEMLQGSEGQFGGLGFGHLVDELKNAINPASGLPENLRLKYSDLEKVTVPQAVERVAKINEWRAANKAEADMARAMGPATHVIKEYPDQGFKWVELKAPKETGRKIGVEKPEMDLPPDFNERMGREVAEDMAFDEGLEEGTREFNDFVRRTMEDFGRKKTVEMDESVKALEDALKYEGETMGHCVGGYCPDVVEGRSKIFSLRDKKGQPHVTIEVAPKPLKTWRDVTAAVGPDESGKLYDEFDKIGGFNMDDTDAAFEMFIKNKGIKAPDDIVQIKGKANRAPKEEYLPAVQDFIRSGNWGNIGDAQNAGMRKFTDVFSSNELRMLQDAGAEFPNSGWLTGEDIQRLHNMITPEGRRLKYDPMGKIIGGEDGSGFSNGGAVRGHKAGGVVRSLEDLHQRYAEGGQVSGANFPTGDFDPARIDTIVGELHALNAG